MWLTRFKPYCGKASMKTLSETTRLCAEFYDVDSCHVVWHGHYVKYMEVARCRLFEKIGHDYQAMADSGFFYPIVDLNLKFVQPLKFTQHFDITAELIDWEGRLKIIYSIVDSETQEKITKGSTTQVAVRMPENELQFELPSAITEKILQALQHQ